MAYLQRGLSSASGTNTHSLSLMDVGVSTFAEYSSSARVCGLSLVPEPGVPGIHRALVSEVRAESSHLFVCISLNL